MEQAQKFHLLPPSLTITLTSNPKQKKNSENNAYLKNVVFEIKKRMLRTSPPRNRIKKRLSKNKVATQEALKGTIKLIQDWIFKLHYLSFLTQLRKRMYID